MTTMIRTDLEEIESVLLEHFLRIGIAATILARHSLDRPNREVRLRNGLLMVGDANEDEHDYAAGVSSVEPTADHWEWIVQKI